MSRLLAPHTPRRNADDWPCCSTILQCSLSAAQWSGSHAGCKALRPELAALEAGTGIAAIMSSLPAQTSHLPAQMSDVSEQICMCHDSHIQIEPPLP